MLILQDTNHSITHSIDRCNNKNTSMLSPDAMLTDFDNTSLAFLKLELTNAVYESESLVFDSVMHLVVSTNKTGVNDAGTAADFTRSYTITPKENATIEDFQRVSP